MLKTTPLFSEHQNAGAKIVPFAGWQMPLHYGSQLQEHHAVRQNAGMFDVSHMCIVDVSGKDAASYLRLLLANDVAKLQDGRALYSCMLNESGGVIDDLIVYRLTENQYRLVLNAATREKDLNWLQQLKEDFDLQLRERSDLAMIALQGPQAIAKLGAILPVEQYQLLSQLKPFSVAQMGDWLVARTGYTGEDGLEIQLPTKEAITLWNDLKKQGVQPCGLGARDTLRLEAGLNLYGVDMDETTSPLESNLGWTVAFLPQERDFIGRRALQEQLKLGVQRQLVGLILESPGVLRNHQKVVLPNDGEGEITSGSFSPTLGHAIALARVPINAGENAMVNIRQAKILVRIIKPPFVRKGKKVFT